MSSDDNTIHRTETQWSAADVHWLRL